MNDGRPALSSSEGRVSPANDNSRRKDDDARWIGLDAEPVSVAALKMIENLTPRLWTASGSKTNFPNWKFKRAVGALIADLLRAESEGRKSFRSMRNDTFEGGEESVGRDPFKRAVKAMAALEFIDVEWGHQLRRGDQFVAGQASRFVVRKELLVYAEWAGVSPKDWFVHFRFRSHSNISAKPLFLRSSSERFGRWKVKGRPMPIDFADPDVATMAATVNEINGFLVDQVIELPDDPRDPRMSLRRGFSEGDRTAGKLNSGGRLYASGEWNYQSISRERRQSLRINGEVTTELDIRASYLTILHAKLGQPLDLTRDPYAIDGVPRDLVKCWIVQTLGRSDFPTKWASASDLSHDDNERRLRAEQFKQMKRNHRIKDVGEAVLNHLPLLRSWPESPYRWGDLQFIESNAVVHAVHRLATTHRIVALPLHDSIIVPISDKAKARIVLSRSFERHVGVRPVITEK